MPLSDQPAWDLHIEDCAICTSRDRDALTLLRCTVHTLLDHGRFMAADDIPLAAILADGGDYLHRLGASPGGDHPTPVPGPEHWAWVDAEVRLALARAAGLHPVGTLDPRIDDVIAAASRWPARRQEDLFLRAAEQFAAQHTAAPSAPDPPAADGTRPHRAERVRQHPRPRHEETHIWLSARPGTLPTPVDMK